MLNRAPIFAHYSAKMAGCNQYNPVTYENTLQMGRKGPR
jgi:hypothetical protein